MSQPPPVGILFKAKPRGAVWEELNSDPSIPPWMNIQTQEAGSYRSENMVELIAETLPPAETEVESAVLCLD